MTLPDPMSLLFLYLLSGVLSALSITALSKKYLARFLPGLIFGFLHGPLHLRTIGPILAYAFFSSVAYYVAYFFADQLYEKARSLLVAGLVAGSVGALILTASLQFLGDVPLSLLVYGRTVVLGGLFGVLFLYLIIRHRPKFVHSWFLAVTAFTLWQSAVGVSLDIALFGSAAEAVVARGWLARTNTPFFQLVPLILTLIALMQISPSTGNDEASTRSAVYSDLPAALTRHTWLALTYALASVVLIYTLGLLPSTSLLFFALLAPTIAAIIYVISNNRVLRARVPLLWAITCLIAWTYNIAGASKAWVVDALWVGVILMVTYWLTLAISTSAAEFRHNRQETTTAALAWLLSAWGATLQVAFVVLLLVKQALDDKLISSLGANFISALQLIRLTSPIMWLPSGLFALGILFFAVCLFADFPYHAADFKDVLAFKLPPLVNELFAAIRIPAWLVVVIFGFLGHFIKLIGEALVRFGDKWLGRFVLSVVALIAPVLLLLVGHHAFYNAMARVFANLLAGPGNLRASLFVFLAVHILVLFALSAYVVSLAPLGMTVTPVSIKKVPAFISEYLKQEGFPAAKATGKAFALYGIIFLAVPIAALLPGGSGWGVFSTCYAVMLAVLALFYLAKAVPRKRA